VAELKGILSKRGLQLNETKTRIVNTLDGFDFLGFNIKHITKRGWERVRGVAGNCENGIHESYRKYFSTIIRPSEKSLKSIKLRIKGIFGSHRGRSPATLIRALNPVIRGYCESKRTRVFSQAARHLQHYLFKLQMGWIRRRHPKKSTDWCVNRYFKKYKSYFIDSAWTFHCPETGVVCYQFIWFSKERFWPPVIAKNCPDDPSLRSYWQDRDDKILATKCISIFNNLELELARSQKATCPICEQSLLSGEPIHTHHIVPTKEGGKTTFGNLILVHMHCHQHVHYGKVEGFDWKSSLMQFKIWHPRQRIGRQATDGDFMGFEHEDLVD
jgi:RNA-directed DNA polymerase